MKITGATVLLTLVFMLVMGAWGVNIAASANDPAATVPNALSYPVVDTGQDQCYDNTGGEIACPGAGQAFGGQDAQYAGHQPSYTDNGDGTITDNTTGLMWQKTPGAQMTYAAAGAGASSFNLASYNDWRLPTLKELYSLMDFRGRTGLSAETSTPYLDTHYFDFEYGDTSAGDRFIDAQYWSSTEYVGTTMNGDATVFGVNFADGRIKGYPRDVGPGGGVPTHFVRYVRGNPNYGDNQFVDNGDGTITDQATGLMWMKADSGKTLNWEEALAYAQNLQAAGYDDWRLPNAKEMQSIVDYTRAPDATNAAQRGPAIDPIFDITSDDSFFWTSTTHVDGPAGGDKAVYIAFGEAWGWMEQPPNSGNYVLLNVHGAGAQRSDPKSGNPDDYPHGFGPQGDVARIYNYVRAVRTVNDQAATPTATPASTTTPAPTATPQPTPTPTGSQTPGQNLPLFLPYVTQINSGPRGRGENPGRVGTGGPNNPAILLRPRGRSGSVTRGDQFPARHTEGVE